MICNSNKLGISDGSGKDPIIVKNLSVKQIFVGKSPIVSNISFRGRFSFKSNDSGVPQGCVFVSSSSAWQESVLSLGSSSILAVSLYSKIIEVNNKNPRKYILY